MNCLVRAPSAVLSLLPALVGQSDAVRTSFGVTTHEGVLRGLGPDYSARFEANGVTFTPLLGDRVSEPATLRFTLTSVRRGDTNVFARSRDIAPVAVDSQVRYPHDANVVETYDVRQDGIEQSFVFAQRPAGTGDLVVRGQITTELPLTTASDDGARFERAGAGGVTFGAVTGVDANGARMRGSLRCDGRWLELSLPASFVDSAAYPLVLDPLIGSSFLIANIAGGSDVLSSIAYDETTQRYLVVWHAGVSATVAEVRAQFVSAAGFVGPQILLDSTTLAGVRPVVANFNQRNRFVVAWGQSPGFTTLVAVDAVNGAVSTTAIWSPTGDVQGLAIGGDSRTPMFGVADDGLLVATTTGSGGTSWAHRVRMDVPAVGPPNLVQTWSIAAAQPRRFGPPAVSKHGGSAGRWMFTFAWRDNGAANVGTFTIELLAPTAPVLALIVGFTQNPFACGPCTIVPSADILLAGSGPVPVNLPLNANLIGSELFTQWLQLRQSGCPILPDFGFSNTLKFTIAE